MKRSFRAFQGAVLSGELFRDLSRDLSRDLPRELSMQSVDVAENDRTQPRMDGFYPSSDRQFRKDGSRLEHRYWKAINWTLLGATLGSCERFNSLTRDEYYLVEIL